MKSNTKHSVIVIVVLLCLSLVIYFLFPKPPCSITSFDKRAVWLTYQDLSELSYDSKEAFEKEFQEMIQTIKKYKNNTIIVQVRAFSDALYNSNLFPLSQVITNQTSLSFDPLQVMVDIAHNEGISIEAWINPYRISLNKQTYMQFFNSSHRAWLKDPHYTIHYGSYQYILNPANAQVRKYIVEGVKEIVSHYKVDGIHFDDYFYISGTHGQTTQDERLDNVNILIQDVYQSIKEMNSDISFGISPQGNYENCLIEGADIDTWLKEEGYIDYLMPQIYWSNQYDDGKTTMFTNRAKLFAGLKRHKNVQLYAGLALYHAGENINNDLGWSLSHQNISDQVQVLSELGYDGYSVFKYASLKNESGKKEMDELLKVHP